MQETVLTSEPLTHARLLADAWPDGVPPREVALWQALNHVGRGQATVRLAAMLAYERGAGRNPELKVSRPRFYAMLKAWRANRSLASLVPAVLGRKGKGAGRSVDPALRAMVARLVRDEPGRSKEQIVRRIMAQLPDTPSATTLRHLVDTERATAAREALGGDTGFGRLVAIDTSPVFLRGKEEEEAIGAMVGMVIDQATGLVIGYAVDDAETDIVRKAVERAALNLAVISVGVETTKEMEIEVAVLGDAMEKIREMKRLRALPHNITVVSARRDRPIGTRLLELFGPTIGKLDLRPRAILPARESRTPTKGHNIANWQIIIELLEPQITEHNGAILQRGIVAGASIEELASALQRIAPMLNTSGAATLSVR